MYFKRINIAPAICDMAVIDVEGFYLRIISDRHCLKANTELERHYSRKQLDKLYEKFGFAAKMSTVGSKTGIINGQTNNEVKISVNEHLGVSEISIFY